MSVLGNIIRLEVDAADPYRAPAIKNTGQPIRLPRSRDIILQLGVYEAGVWVENPSHLVLVTAEVKATRTGAAVAVANTSTIANIQQGQWDANTHQHLSITLPAAQTAGFPTADETTYWLVITATVTGGIPITLLAGVVTVVNDGGDYSATVPSPGDPSYYTKAQVEARLQGIGDDTIEENGFRGRWGIGANGQPIWRRLQ